MPTTRRKTTPEELPEPMSLLEALLCVRKGLGAVPKAERNPHFGFQFRGIETVLNNVVPWFDKYGLLIYPSAVKQAIPAGSTVILVVEYRICWKDESLTVEVAAQQADAIKAMSVAYRIAHLQALQLPTGEPDPESLPPTEAANSADQPAREPDSIDTALADAQARVQTVWLTYRSTNRFDFNEAAIDYGKLMGGSIGNATAGDLHRFADLMEGQE